jgi:hypothetical protein
MGALARVWKHPQQIRRRYKRNYMRVWRARPGNCERERGTRQRSYANQKLHRAGEPVQRLCGFCHQRVPIEKVVRLRPVGNGYVEMRVPYCGQC